MKTSLPGIHCLTLVPMLLLSGCSGGGINPSIDIFGSPLVSASISTSPEAVSAIGVISAPDSVTLNGVRYGTASTQVTINGEPASPADLKRGQIVMLEGTIEPNGLAGTADRVSYEASVIGPVENIDGPLGRLIVMGQPIRIDAGTVFDITVDPDTLVGLIVGSGAEISGFVDANGEIAATRIEPDAGAARVQLIGRVIDLDTANMLFSINRQIVDYSGALLIELPGGAPVDGMFVNAKGELVDGILIVDQITSANWLEPGNTGERIQTQGLITRFDSSTDFDLNGFPITSNAATVLANGSINELRINTEVLVDGQITTDGRRISANEIIFRHVVNPTTTVTIDLSDFTDISVFSVFYVTIMHGPNFSVEVTIDEDAVNHLDVKQIGSRLSIGLLPGNNELDTISAVVTLPLLNSIDLNGVIYATLSGFKQSHLTANVGGVSLLRGESLMIDDLEASVFGVSGLSFGHNRPLRSANINISGVSYATLNMGIGSALSGTVSGASLLMYFGTNVMRDITTHFPSLAMKLGETRP